MKLLCEILMKCIAISEIVKFQNANHEIVYSYFIEDEPLEGGDYKGFQY